MCSAVTFATDHRHCGTYFPFLLHNMQSEWLDAAFSSQRTKFSARTVVWVFW